MKLKDNIFIFLTAVLLILFTLKIGEDIRPSLVARPSEDLPKVDIGVGQRIRELEAIGIVPREAKYYEVIDE